MNLILLLMPTLSKLVAPKVLLILIMLVETAYIATDQYVVDLSPSELTNNDSIATTVDAAVHDALADCEVANVINRIPK